MRLRSRAPRTLGEDWVQPRGSGRWTAIGNLDSPWRGLVDPAGLVSVAGATWSLDWWVGAEDRWHLPCREVAVRQSLLGSAPVVETRLRVPGGDALHRAYAARSAAGDEALVVEVENQSKLPFAVALAVRPYDQAAVGRIDNLVLDGTTVRIDGAEVLVLPRSPGRIALSDGAGGDSAATVLAGDADVVGPASVACRDGLAQAALLFPLAHTATMRVVLPLGPRRSVVAPAGPAFEGGRVLLPGQRRDLPAGPSGGGQSEATPGVREGGGSFPTGVQVAAGWGAHAGRGARVEVPDRRLRDAVAAGARHLLLGPVGPRGAAALDLLGFADDASRALLRDPTTLARSDHPGSVLHAVARHWELVRDDGFAREAAGLVAALVARLGRGGEAPDQALGAAALGAAAGLLDAAGERRGAGDIRAVAPPSLPGEPADVTDDADRSADAERLSELLSSASSTWTWPGPSSGHDLDANAELVTLVRRLLVDDGGAGLVLCPSVPGAWLGQGWELHDAPTRHGRLSYAVRWHGERPALLWELRPHAGAAPVGLTVRGLDPGWSTTDAVGEALLDPVALPERAPRRGLRIPVAIEPMPGRRP